MKFKEINRNKTGNIMIVLGILFTIVGLYILNPDKIPNDLKKLETKTEKKNTITIKLPKNEILLDLIASKGPVIFVSTKDTIKNTTNIRVYRVSHNINSISFQ